MGGDGRTPSLLLGQRWLNDEALPTTAAAPRGGVLQDRASVRTREPGSGPQADGQQHPAAATPRLPWTVERPQIELCSRNILPISLATKKAACGVVCGVAAAPRCGPGHRSSAPQEGSLRHSGDAAVPRRPWWHTEGPDREHLYMRPGRETPGPSEEGLTQAWSVRRWKPQGLLHHLVPQPPRNSPRAVLPVLVTSWQGSAATEPGWLPDSGSPAVWK